MACVSTDLDCALSYALQRLGTLNLILKSEQRSVIESICNGKDTFVWLPTRFGKSTCYQTLPFVFDKISRKCAAGGNVVVVVLPLISLMEDQVASLSRHLHWTTWTPSRSAIQTAHFCCSPALLNNATLFLLFGTD